MATATAPARRGARDARRPTPGRGTLTGTGTLVRFMLRRDRVRLPAWAAGFGLFVLYLASALPVAYGERDLQGVTAMFHDPVGRLLTGPGYGFDAPTYERLVANGYGLYFLLLGALMSILLVVRHTRVEEQTGRAELVRATVVGRHAGLTAALLMAGITNLVVGAVIASMMIGVGGYGPAGSLVFAAGIAAVGLAFAGIAAVTVQLTEYSRAAAGTAGIVLGASFVLRAGGDMAREGGAALSWSSPLAWPQQTAPFVLDRWWPLLLPLGLALVATATGYLLADRRDLGASPMAARPGRARAGRGLGTPLGLALRLQRAGIIGWTLAMTAAGLVYGAFVEALLAATDDMPETFLELFGREDMLAGYLSYMAVFMAFVVSVYVVLAIQGLRGEETSGRVEPVLATAVGRAGWLGSNLAVVGAAVALLLAAAGAGTGVGAAVVTGEGGYVLELTLAHLTHVPAVLVVLAVATLLLGLLPRAIPAAWALVGYGVVVGTFAPLLDLPDLAYDLSPFEHAGRLPGEAFTPTAVVVLSVVAVVLAGIGLLGLRRRDLEVT